MTDIIIVSYKDEEELKRCVSSVEEHCTDYTLFIEDNNVLNRGYTKAVNDGIKKGSGEWVWLLNSDAVVLPGAQQGLIDQFSYHEKVGIVGSMQIDYDNRDIIRHGGTLSALPGQHAGGRISMGHCQIPTKQKWVNFASALLRRHMVDEIGLLDERFFLICSDSDYCYTARQKGWSVFYTPYSRVLHKLKASKNPSEWHQKDMQAFLEKWGITAIPDGKFIYSDLFSRLDMFP